MRLFEHHMALFKIIIRVITREEVFHSRGKPSLSPAHLDLNVELVTPMIRVAMSRANEHTANERRQSPPQFLHTLRFNVSTWGACKTEKQGSCQKHSHRLTTLHIRLLHFLTRGKQEHYSWPGPHCFLTSSPREPVDCTLIFIWETSCQN